MITHNHAQFVSSHARSRAVCLVSRPHSGCSAQVWEGGTRTPAILAGGYLPTNCHGKESHAFMHVSDWMATLAAVAGVPASALAHANASGPKPLDSHDLSTLLFSDAGSCGADRTKSPRESLMYARLYLALLQRHITFSRYNS